MEIQKLMARSPVFPLSQLKELHDNPEEALIKLWGQKFFKCAIYIANPKWFRLIKNRTIIDLLKDERAKRTLFKYAIRMCSRATPYGLFSGISVFDFDDKTEVEFTDKFASKVFFRLDIGVFFAIYNYIVSLENVMKSSTFYLNPTLSSMGGEIRYNELKIDTKNDKLRARQFILDENTVIKDIIQFLSSKRKFGELFDWLVNEGYEGGESEDYILDLVNSGVIVNDLFPSATDPHFLATFISKLEKQKLEKEIFFDSLIKISNSIGSLNLDIGELSVDKLFLIEEYIKEQFPVINPDSTFFHVDVKKGLVKNKVSKDILAYLPDIALFLRGLNNVSKSPLSRFLEIYGNRFKNKSISILQIMDRDLGINIINNNLPNQIGENIFLDFFSDSKFERKEEMDPFLLEKFLSAKLRNESTICLTDLDISIFKEDKDLLSNQSLGYLLEKIIDEDSGDSFLFNGIISASPNTILGRFNYLDNELIEIMQDCNQKEKKINDAIYAEILHIPNAKTGNVVLRRSIEKNEILLHSNHSADAENVIKLSDLYVKVENNKVILFSKKINKIVIPIITNAHNFMKSDSLPIYRFLALVGLQYRHTKFDIPIDPFLKKWGSFPRLTYRNIVLVPKTLLIRKGFFKGKDVSDVKKFLIQSGFSDYFILSENTDRLVLNLLNNLSLSIVLKCAITQDLYLMEYLNNSCFVTKEIYNIEFNFNLL
ncbi:MAG: lantibiotic dehydratase family protein [Sphingobacterium sp.]|jgi:hypothetical protein|nr:lantibiotic dehydratase family protein [Sphingobacterium sp.]